MKHKHLTVYDLLKKVRGTIPAPPSRIFKDQSKYTRKLKFKQLPLDPYGHF